MAKVFVDAFKALGPEIDKLEGLKALQDECKRAGGLERLIAEVDARRSEADRALSAVKATVEKEKTTLAGLQDESAQVRDQNTKLAADGRNEIERIKAEAEEIKARATKDIEAMLQAGRDTAAAKASEAERAKALADDELAGVRGNILTAQAELAEAEQRKRDVEAEIARLRNLFKQ